MTVPQKSGFTPGRENIPAAIAAMLGLTTPPAGARYEFRWQDGAFVKDDGSDPYSESALKRREVARAKERDRDSRRAPLVVLWKSIDGFDMDHFERVGKRFTRQVMLDNLPEFAGVKRGAALTVKPNEELRRKIRLFKDIQATREAAFEFTGKGKYGGEDVPLRVGLGGLQDFTASRENTHKRPKGYAPWRPQKKTTRLMFQVKQILDEYRDHLPLTGRQIFYRMVAAYGYLGTHYPECLDALRVLDEHETAAHEAALLGDREGYLEALRSYMKAGRDESLRIGSGAT
jgi:hypothetical protein